MLVRFIIPYLYRQYSLGILFVAFFLFMFAAIFFISSVFFFAGEPHAYASEINVYRDSASVAVAVNGLCSVVAIFFVYKFFTAGADGLRFGFIAFILNVFLMGIRCAFEPALIAQARNQIYIMGACFIALIVIWYLKRNQKPG